MERTAAYETFVNIRNKIDERGEISPRLHQCLYFLAARTRSLEAMFMLHANCDKFEASLAKHRERLMQVEQSGALSPSELEAYRAQIQDAAGKLASFRARDVDCACEIAYLPSFFRGHEYHCRLFEECGCPATLHHAEYHAETCSGGRWRIAHAECCCGSERPDASEGRGGHGVKAMWRPERDAEWKSLLLWLADFAEDGYIESMVDMEDFEYEPRPEREIPSMVRA